VRYIDDFRQSFWDCWVRDPYPVRPTDGLIVDAGANIGCFSIYAAARAPEANIVALEPSGANFARLERNVERNRLGDRIAVRQLGDAGATGELELDVGHGSPFHSSFLAQRGLRAEKTETIRVLSLADLLALLDDEMPAAAPATIDLLKMDCEGAEMDCLLQADPASLARVRRLVVEYHEWAGFRFDDVRERLEAAGFTLAGHEHFECFQTGLAEFRCAAVPSERRPQETVLSGTKPSSCSCA